MIYTTISKKSREMREKSGKCSKCDETNNLIMHHIDTDVTNNNDLNLVILCRKCHGRIHADMRPRKQDIALSLPTRLVKALDDLAADKRILPLNRSQQIEELLVQLPEVQKRLLVKE